MVSGRRSIRDNYRNKVSPKGRTCASPTVKSPQSATPNSSPAYQRNKSTSDSEFEGFDEHDRSANSSSDKCYHVVPNEYTNHENPLPMDGEIMFERKHVYRKTQGETRHRHKESERTDPLTTGSRKTVKVRHNLCSPMICIAAILLVICSVIFLVFILPKFTSSSKKMTKPTTFSEMYDQVISDLKDIKSSMPQTRHLWTEILSQLTDLFDNSIRQPSVILAVLPKNSQKTGTCLINVLSGTITDAFGDSSFVTFDVKSHTGDPPSLKLDLDNALKGLQDSHVAIIYNLEKLPGEAAMMLHSYCDNDNAPFKRVLIFLILVVDEDHSDMQSRNLNSYVDDHLSSLWTGVGGIREVDASTLASRIANAVVLIGPESPDAIQDQCDF